MVVTRFRVKLDQNRRPKQFHRAIQHYINLVRNSRNPIMALGLIDLIHNRPAIFHVLKDWWDKIDVTWFLRGQERGKIYQWKKSWSPSLKNRKFRMEWKSLVGSDHCYFFGRSSDRRCSHYSDQKLCKTYRISIVHFAWLKSSTRFEKINKLDLDYSYWQILSLVWPPEIPRDIASIPSILRRLQKWRVSWIRSILKSSKYPVSQSIAG